MWNSPSGCQYTENSSPIGNIVSTGVNVCNTAKFGITGAAFFPSNANVGSCEVRIDDGSNIYVLYPRSAVSANATSWSFSAPYTYEVTASRTVTISVVYWEVGASTSAPPYGNVLDTDIRLNVFSGASDPVVTVDSVRSYIEGFTDNIAGTKGMCGLDGDGTCTFVYGTPANATVVFTPVGGNANGVRYTLVVEFYNAGWQTLCTTDLGVVRPGSWWSKGSNTFNMPNMGSVRRQFRVSVSYTSVEGSGGTKTVYSQIVTIGSKTPTSQETCVPARCSGTCTNGVCVPRQQELCNATNCVSPNQCVAGVCTRVSGDESGSCNPPCPSYQKCLNGSCVFVTDPDPVEPTSCNASNCPSPNTCVSGQCVVYTTKVCNSTTCPSPGVCQTDGSCKRVVASTSCNGLERDGELDPTCVLESGNEIYLYGAVGIILLMMLMKRR